MIQFIETHSDTKQYMYDGKQVVGVVTRHSMSNGTVMLGAHFLPSEGEGDFPLIPTEWVLPLKRLSGSSGKVVALLSGRVDEEELKQDIDADQVFVQTLRSARVTVVAWDLPEIYVEQL